MIMTTSRSQTRHKIFGEGWEALNIGYGDVHYGHLYESRMISIQEMMVMTIINNFLLSNTSKPRIPWNLLDMVNNIMKEGAMYAWEPTMLLQTYR